MHTKLSYCSFGRRKKAELHDTCPKSDTQPDENQMKEKIS